MSGSYQNAQGTSQQLDILQAMTALLQGITPENGYAYDLSRSVFRGRAFFGDDAPIPCISILENPRPGVALDANEWKSIRKASWELLVQGWAVDDKLNPLDPVYQLKASVELRLARVVATVDSTGRAQFPSDFRLGGRIIQMRIGPGVTRPADKQISSKAFFFLPLTIEYNENLAQPFLTA